MYCRCPPGPTAHHQQSRAAAVERLRGCTSRQNQAQNTQLLAVVLLPTPKLETAFVDGR